MNGNLADISIQFVKGVGPARKKLFANLEVESVEDLLYLFPRRYEDRRNMIPIAQVQTGEWQSIAGTVRTFSERKTWHTKKQVTEVLLDDGSGVIVCVWFNQPYLKNYFHSGKKVVCYGRVDRYKNRLQMISPEYEVIESEEDEQLNLQRIVPVYPLTRGITQRYLRKVMKSCLDKYGDQLRDELPAPLRRRLGLDEIRGCITQIHYPDDPERQEAAIKRVSFEEFYFFQVSIILRRMSIKQKEGIAHKVTDAFSLRFCDAFPFELTKAQKKVIRDVKEDMGQPVPMLRLLQGDVGSGKTVVALYGCLAAADGGHQAAFMAPTEILARQHYENICRFVADGPFKDVSVELLSSSLKKKDRDEVLQRIADGQAGIVVGTHALITEDVTFQDLSYVVIDEQHKFGVRQRALLSEKGNNPDVLIMTATPIPRTLCITLYGDLDVSVINEIPPGRGTVETQHYTHEEADKAYDLVRRRIREGRQAYVVYPIIEESEKLDLKAAQEMFRKFKTSLFKDQRIALVHGKMKQAETEAIMRDFKAGKIDLLVATTVLEVGVDVANATVMVIEHADRFGLAQLHQLRGRIGRGEHDGLCLLVAEPKTQDGQRRLEAICATTDGFKIAQYDLEIRGPGKYFGRHQHGLNELKVANPATQLDVLELARKEAKALTAADPFLKKNENREIRRVIGRRYPTYLAMVAAG